MQYCSISSQPNIDQPWSTESIGKISLNPDLRIDVISKVATASTKGRIIKAWPITLKMNSWKKKLEKKQHCFFVFNPLVLGLWIIGYLKACQAVLKESRFLLLRGSEGNGWNQKTSTCTDSENPFSKAPESKVKFIKIPLDTKPTQPFKVHWIKSQVAATIYWVLIIGLLRSRELNCPATGSQ